MEGATRTYRATAHARALIASGEWLIEWAQRQGFWTRKQCELERRLVQDSRTAYRRWFVDRDRIWANAPEREQWIEPPRFRHNACQGCRVVGAAGGGVAGRLGDLCVGYDPGLLLLTLSRLNHSAAPAAYRRLLRLVDSAGAWNEYYDGEDRPFFRSIRANVWASGINAAVLLEYLSCTESSRTERSVKPVECSNRNRHDSK